jgi:lipid-binding SYLF domain-containing protein
VFPKVVKAGFMVGGQFGKGVLIKGSKEAGRYNIAAASYGLQAGAQGFSYAMFFMNDKARARVSRQQSGFEIGVSASVRPIPWGANGPGLHVGNEEDCDMARRKRDRHSRQGVRRGHLLLIVLSHDRAGS